MSTLTSPYSWLLFSTMLLFVYDVVVHLLSLMQFFMSWSMILLLLSEPSSVMSFLILSSMVSSLDDFIIDDIMIQECRWLVISLSICCCSTMMSMLLILLVIVAMLMGLITLVDVLFMLMLIESINYHDSFVGVL